MTIEDHPLSPFLPENGKILFLGSFPPPKARWSMEFFYPNWINDFWRVQGLLFYADSHHFEVGGEKRFDLVAITAHCHAQGLAFFDTARRVCRLKDNASDDYLEILEGTDVFELLRFMPQCHIVVTTGGKASEELSHYFETKGLVVEVPKVGEHVSISCSEWQGEWWRMPSTSRAYPMKLERKASYYEMLFQRSFIS